MLKWLPRTFLIIFSLLVHGNPTEIGSSGSADYRAGDPVSTLVPKICKADFSKEMCEEVTKEVLFQTYGVAYAASSHEDLLKDRGHVLFHLTQRFSYTRYLEIGCDLNQVFDVFRNIFPHAVCVDPAKGGTVRLTSDEYFNSIAGSSTEYFDLIFIDGMHEANQVYRDFTHAIDRLLPGGTIVLHDCNPQGLLNLAVSMPRHPDALFWNGDVWKAAVAIRLLSDVEIVVVDIDHGVGVIRRRANKHPLSDEWKQLLSVAPIAVLTTAHLVNHRNELLRMMSMKQFELWLEEE